MSTPSTKTSVPSLVSAPGGQLQPYLEQLGVTAVTSPESLFHWDRLFQYSEQSFGAFSKNTQTMMRSAWNGFVKWCVANNRCPLPATAETVRLYVFSHIRYVERANLGD